MTVTIKNTMKIKKIKIENYKSIKKLTLDFDCNSKVIIGLDDKTRTDVLDAIAVAVSSFFCEFYDDDVKTIPITTKDSCNRLNEVIYPIRIASELEIENKTIHTVTELLDDTVKKTGIRKQKNKELVELSKDIRKRIMLGQSFPLPLIAYYPIDREMYPTITEGQGMEKCSRVAGYANCLSKKQNVYIFQWLIACEFVEYHCKEKIFVLDYFREIVTSFNLPTNPFYDWDNSSRNSRILFSIVADLAFRSAYLNNEFCRYADLKNNGVVDSGVVLIDAIELHLDLEWQREFMPKLKALFPNIQFITSTTSPLVLSTTKPQDVIILESIQDQLITKSTESSYGMTCDRILEDLLETSARPDKIDRAMRFLFQVMNEGNIQVAIDTKEELTKLIGSDPELTKAEVLIKRKQSLEK